MLDWKVDSKARQITSPDGSLFTATRVGDRWSIRPQDIDGELSKTLIAITVWNAALQEGIDLLTLAGKTCFGPDWMVRLSNELDLTVGTVKRWLSKERPLTLDDTVWIAVARVVDDHYEVLQQQIATIQEFEKVHPVHWRTSR